MTIFRQILLITFILISTTSYAVAGEKFDELDEYFDLALEECEGDLECAAYAFSYTGFDFDRYYRERFNPRPSIFDRFDYYDANPGTGRPVHGFVITFSF